MEIVKMFKSVITCCFKQTHSSNDCLYEKARSRLDKELDVRQIIGSMRFARNIFAHLTSNGVRKLVRMQARHNVLELDEDTKPALMFEEDDHSSNFEGEKQLTYMNQLINSEQLNFPTSLDEQSLLAGIPIAGSNLPIKKRQRRN